MILIDPICLYKSSGVNDHFAAQKKHDKYKYRYFNPSSYFLPAVAQISVSNLQLGFPLVFSEIWLDALLFYVFLVTYFGWLNCLQFDW